MQTRGRPNRDAVLAALEIYRGALRPFVVRILSGGGSPTTEVIASALVDWRRREFLDDINRGVSPADALRIEDFPDLILERWSEFRDPLNDNRGITVEMDVITAARDSVNNLGENDLALSQTSTDLTHIANVLGDIGEADAADRVRALRDRRNLSAADPEAVAADQRPIYARLPRPRKLVRLLWDGVVGFEVALALGMFGIAGAAITSAWLYVRQAFDLFDVAWIQAAMVITVLSAFVVWISLQLSGTTGSKMHREIVVHLVSPGHCNSI